MAKSIMIQGAGSNVGKSLLVAGLCRAFVRRGLRVLPFKPQNMSNNAAVTINEGEIGRAQALQARACGVAPHTDMNPVLLKPESETGAQVVVQGQRIATAKARAYGEMKSTLMPKVLESFHRLAANADLVIVEGAGSPAEINLRSGDIANMGFAQAAGVPVVLVGDIDRGGVIAQLVGTEVILDPADRELVRGFIINKFRGDIGLFDTGLEAIVERTGWHSMGVVPWFEAAHKLPAEDSSDLRSLPRGGDFVVAVPRFPRIANFDDIDPLKLEDGVSVVLVEPGQPLPRDTSLVLLPGSKSTIGDLKALRENGWEADIHDVLARGGHVIGLCGGYQMLGKRIEDPDGIEGPAGGVDGLGLLDVVTVMQPQKRLAEVQAKHLETGAEVRGYEIHKGVTEGPDCDRAMLMIGDRPEGAISPSGQVMGTYLHGLFTSDDFRSQFLARLGADASGLRYDQEIDQTLDALADHVEAHIPLDFLWAMVADVSTA